MTKAARNTPYGWARGTHGALVEVPEEQQVIARMLELREEGCSNPQIAEALNDDGYRPRRAQTWGESSVRSVLKRIERKQESPPKKKDAKEFARFAWEPVEDPFDNSESRVYLKVDGGTATGLTPAEVLDMVDNLDHYEVEVTRPDPRNGEVVEREVRGLTKREKQMLRHQHRKEAVRMLEDDVRAIQEMIRIQAFEDETGYFYFDDPRKHIGGKTTLVPIDVCGLTRAVKGKVGRTILSGKQVHEQVASIFRDLEMITYWKVHEAIDRLGKENAPSTQWFKKTFTYYINLLTEEIALQRHVNMHLRQWFIDEVKHVERQTWQKAMWERRPQSDICPPLVCHGPESAIHVLKYHTEVGPAYKVYPPM